MLLVDTGLHGGAGGASFRASFYFTGHKSTSVLFRPETVTKHASAHKYMQPSAWQSNNATSPDSIQSNLSNSGTTLQHQENFNLDLLNQPTQPTEKLFSSTTNFTAGYNDITNTFLIENESRISADELSPISYGELLDFQRQIMRNLTAAHHIDDPQFDYLRHSGWRGFILVLYVTVIVLGLIGNCLVVFVVSRNKHSQNVTNIFIANLALSDIGLCAFSLPVQLYYQLTDHWIFGHALCKIVFTAFAVPMYVSTLTILLIAFDRYWLIVYPLARRMRIPTAISLIIAGFLISLILALPVIWFTSEHHLQDPVLNIDRKYCIERWPNAASRITYSISMFFFQFCLPLCMTTLLYYKIYCRLRNRPSQRTTPSERARRTNKILFAIVVLFVVCWLPWNLYSLIVEIDISLVRGAHFKLIDLLLKLFAMSSACINPFLYCWLNDNFRKELDTVAIKLKIIRNSSLRSSTNNRAPQIRYDHSAMMRSTHDAAALHSTHGHLLTTESRALLQPGFLSVGTHARPSISQCHSTVHTTILDEKGPTTQNNSQ